MSTIASNDSSKDATTSSGLCASCDRCRSRKTKCDGARPCSNCAAKYMKKNRLTSIEDVPVEEFQCIYSPAKRRGPIPGNKATHNAQAAHGLDAVGSSEYSDDVVTPGSSTNSPDQLLTSGQFGNQVMGRGDAANNAEYLLQSQLAAVLQTRGCDDITQMGTLGTSGVSPASFVGMGIGGLNLNSSRYPSGVSNEGMLNALQQEQQRQMMYPQSSPLNLGSILGAGSAHVQAAAAAQQQLNYLQQLQAAISAGRSGHMGRPVSCLADAGAINELAGSTLGLDTQRKRINILQQQQQQQHLQQQLAQQNLDLCQNQSTACNPIDRKPQRIREFYETVKVQSRSCLKHLALLQMSNDEGNRLRAFFELSVNELYNLPHIPTDEEYCTRLSAQLQSSVMVPFFDAAALQAARFAELAIGALVNGQVALALELSNDTVTCLRDCAEKPVHPSCLYDVARAYFLHGLLRSFRGDMTRYFKYRRVCLSHLNQLDKIPGVDKLLAAISFHDAWAYVVYNAEEDSLPNIDCSIPPVVSNCNLQEKSSDGNNSTGQSRKNISLVASNPLNQMWIQGPPPIFTDNEANSLARSLDALSCAIRTCCDQANVRFEEMTKNKKSGLSACNKGGRADQPGVCLGLTPTQSAVLSNKNEFCSRNLILSALSLLQQHEASTSSVKRNLGHHLAISALDAFHENNDDDNGGLVFSDNQIQSLISVCNTALDYPLLLYQGGIIYHMVTNATILLCHLINGIYITRQRAEENCDDTVDTVAEEVELLLFDEVLDIIIAVRKLVNTHRRKLPARMRCHGIPRPKLSLLVKRNSTKSISSEKDATCTPLVDIGETLMCVCRGCQGFVLMACSPCVAAEKALAEQSRRELELQESDAMYDFKIGSLAKEEENEFDKELLNLATEFDMDDDALLNALSRTIVS